MKKYERRPVVDASPGYEISADGTPRKWGRQIPISKGLGGLPTVAVDGYERLLDEVVAWAFFGPPPDDIRGMTVVHFDNDPLNCRVDNLAWRRCDDYVNRRRELRTMKLMRPDHLQTVVPRMPARGIRPSRRILIFDTHI